MTEQSLQRHVELQTQVVSRLASSAQEVEDATRLIHTTLDGFAKIASQWSPSDKAPLTELELSSEETHQLSGIASGDDDATEQALIRCAETADLNAFTWIAMYEARQRAEALESQRPNLRMAGVPIAVKDNMAVQGWPFRAASRTREGLVAQQDAVCVQRLKSAGAVVLGLTNMDELAWGGSSSNELFGTTLNPVDSNRGVGGSSGGSAVAVASGAVPVALGTDTGGSVRLPASLTGVVGFRPSTGVTDMSGVVPLAPSFDTIGPFATSVEDARVVAEVVSGVSLQSPNPPVSKLGVLRELTPFGLDDGVSQAWERLTQIMRGEGIELVELKLPMGRQVFDVWFTIHLMEAFNEHRNVLEEQHSELGAGARVPLMAGAMLPSFLLHHAQGLRSTFNEQITEMMSTVDAVISPTTAFVPPRMDASQISLPAGDMPLFTCMPTGTWLASMAGLPAISLPIPRTKLPVGLQIMSQRGQDAKLLSLAKMVETLMKDKVREQ